MLIFFLVTNNLCNNTFRAIVVCLFLLPPKLFVPLSLKSSFTALTRYISRAELCSDYSKVYLCCAVFRGKKALFDLLGSCINGTPEMHPYLFVKILHSCSL